MSPEECTGWLLPGVREASVFLEEPDLSAEGGIAQPAESTEQGLSCSVAAEASGVPGNTHKVQQQHPLRSFVSASWPQAWGLGGCRELLNSGFAVL